MKPNRNAKQQALDVIPKLKQAIRLERAQMRVKLVLGGKDARKGRDKLQGLISTVEKEEWDSGTLNMICLIDPGKLREIDAIVSAETKGAASLELLNLKEIAEGEEILE